MYIILHMHVSIYNYTQLERVHASSAGADVGEGLIAEAAVRAVG
jgi:hypothetical protein